MAGSTYGTIFKMCIRDSLIGGAVRLFELGHDAQDHIGDVEGNVGDQNRLKSQGDAEGDERQHQGDARDDVRVQHGNVGDPHDHGAGKRPHVIDGHGGRGADDRGRQGGHKCDQQGGVPVSYTHLDVYKRQHLYIRPDSYTIKVSNANL